ncbi:MAG: type IV pili methyl-accepting chemotaxis transducer N-terminal domain-containing protein [Enterobacterales bacterium]|nr:type IV pili methyl-accepting chemotaxis transducer N-terminal domain-containing protein [Enterobacterales bacterium]
MSAAENKNRELKSKSNSGGYIWLLFLAIVAGGVNLGWGVIQGQKNQDRLTKAGNLRVLSQQVAKNASEASKGNPEAFSLLKASVKEFEAQYSHLTTGDDSKGLDPSPDAILNNELAQVGDLWQQMKRNAEEISAGRETVVRLYQISSELSSSIPQMEFLYTNVQDVLLDNRAPAQQVMFATRQAVYLERIIRSFQKVLVGGEDAETASENFDQDVEIFGQILTGMLEGDDMLSSA